MAGISDAKKTNEGGIPPGMAPLDALPLGVDARLDHVSDPDLEGRLMSMGVFPGARMTTVRTTLGRRTYFIRVEHHYIALRRKEAASLMVRPLDANE